MADFDQIPEQALAWVKAGKGAVLATVIKTWGSAPRPVGSQMAISADMEMHGSVSGGCVEGAVIDAALETLKNGLPRILEYGVSDEDAFAVGMACGGVINILVEPINSAQGMPVGILEKLVDMRAKRRPVAYLVNPENWQRRVMEPTAEIDLSARFASDISGFDGSWFINIHNPPLRLIVVGAVHIAQPLLQMARISGYDTSLVDPRTAFASAARFPDTRISHDWPDAALLAQGLDARVGVITLSHDPKLDDPAIMVALKSPVFYLGCLGSRRTHAKRVIRLQQAGFSDAEIGKIHAPVGLDIASKSPAEIAVSILAELTLRLRRVETRR